MLAWFNSGDSGNSVSNSGGLGPKLDVSKCIDLCFYQVPRQNVERNASGGQIPQQPVLNFSPLVYFSNPVFSNFVIILQAEA